MNYTNQRSDSNRYPNNNSVPPEATPSPSYQTATISPAPSSVPPTSAPAPTNQAITAQVANAPATNNPGWSRTSPPINSFSAGAS